MKYQIKCIEVEAVPMTREEYCDMRGWSVPANEDRLDNGMFVTYPNGHDTWVRLPVFNETYTPVKESTVLSRLTDEVMDNSNRLNKLTAFLQAQQSKVDAGERPDIGYEDLRDLFLQQTLMTELNKVLTARLERMQAKG